MNDLKETLPPVDSYQPSVSHYWLEIGIIIGVGLLIVIAGMVWARYFRNKSRRRHSRSTTIMGAGDAKAASTSRRRERYSRRNPTLAETGGLPPIRDDLDASARPPSGRMPT
jgi:hypothetical protein